MSTKLLFAAIKSKVGNQTQKLILITLADIANERGQCWPSHQYIADAAECSKRSVINHLASLEEKGLIRIIRRLDKAGLKTSNVYQFPDVQDLHMHVQDLHGGSEPVAHNTPIDTPIYIYREKWLEWLEYRKQAKKRMTPATVKKQQAFLGKFDFEQQATIIDQSITNGWMGLFEPRGGNDEDRFRKNTSQSRRTKADHSAEIRAATFSTDF